MSLFDKSPWVRFNLMKYIPDLTIFAASKRWFFDITSDVHVAMDSLASHGPLDELAALRLQEEELREHQDSFFANLVDLLLDAGVDIADAQGIERLLQELDLDASVKDDILLYRSQLAELNAAKQHITEEYTVRELSEPGSEAGLGASSSSVQCLACLDSFPEYAASCAGGGDADSNASPSSSAAPACGHYFCASCMIDYVRGAVRDRKCPVRCPLGAGGRAGAGGDEARSVQGSGNRSSSDGSSSSSSSSSNPGCPCTITRGSILALLADHPADLQTYLQLEAESTLDPGSLLYCPHKDCSNPLVLDGDLPPDAPASCPACNRGFCPRCRITGWHEGYSCAAFQALPAHQRSAEDAAVLQLSERQRWRACPACKRMVERNQGCNHMRCLCGGEYCYRCGVQYEQGQKRCGCELFLDAA
ncbi:hypothetical protein PLESTM_000549900 [Pleodorina starrii]|nr:hypothetical protein PLESTM_000549900 [Pleodorina starrii]